MKHIFMHRTFLNGKGETEMETSVNWINTLCPVLNQIYRLITRGQMNWFLLPSNNLYSYSQPLRSRTMVRPPTKTRHMQFKRFIIGQFFRFSSALGQFFMYHMISFLRFVNNNNRDWVKWIYWFGDATVTNATLFTIVVLVASLFFFFITWT